MGSFVSGGGFPPRREWMLFVDGENLAIRARKNAESRGRYIPDGPNARKDVFVWFSGGSALSPRFSGPYSPSHLSRRAYYYTSLVRDDVALNTVREQLRGLGF